MKPKKIESIQRENVCLSNYNLSGAIVNYNIKVIEKLKMNQNQANSSVDSKVILKSHKH